MSPGVAPKLPSAIMSMTGQSEGNAHFTLTGTQLSGRAIDFRMGKGMVLLSYLSFIWATFKGYGGDFKKISIHTVHH